MDPGFSGRPGTPVVWIFWESSDPLAQEHKSACGLTRGIKGWVGDEEDEEEDEDEEVKVVSSMLTSVQENVGQSKETSLRLFISPSSSADSYSSQEL